MDELLGDEEEMKEEPAKERRKHRFFDFIGKESAYEEVQIDVKALKEFVVDFLKSGKLFFVIYILIMTGILFPAGSSYNDVINDVECQLARAVVCKDLLILGMSAVVMLGIQIRQWRKGYLDFLSAIGNSLALVIFVVGYFISYRDRRKVGFWNCEYFSLNRILMMRVTQIVLILVLLVYLITLVKNWKSKKMKLKSFWDSLIMFNKIPFVCLSICTALLLLSLFGVFMRCSKEEIFSVLTGFDMVSMNILSPYICNLGAISSLIGLVMGLLGVYQKQTKGSIFFAITCYLGSVVFVWAAMWLSNYLILVFFH